MWIHRTVAESSPSQAWTAAVPLLTPCVMPLIDRLVKMLLPREDRFFDLLVKGAEIAESSTHIMKRLCEDGDGAGRTALVKEMQDTSCISLYIQPG